ncbi:hypothetical protein CAEBREN_20027 [Caenorhabditis brenneri]|uniref:Uncharacterized protein n=1 Tax=Caenorhabditis brenneri TaxID=135651 RepID=G0MVB8_CAEBE|nr:hypothetical protein CAEBREN_20027 [Caenorhabditis brenneri]
MRAEGLHQLDVKKRIKMMLPDLGRTPKAAAQNVREHLQDKLMTPEFEDYNDYNKCCLLFMFCVQPPKEFIEKLNGQLLVDLNGYIKAINIEDRHQVEQIPQQEKG